MGNNFNFRVASDTDYDRLVVEIFYGELPIAVLDSELGNSRERIVFCSGAVDIRFPVDELLASIKKAQEEIRTHGV